MLECLDCIHLTFLFYLRATFRKIGYFVGSHPWKVIVFVNLMTVFCAYAAVSVMWPFAYNPELNDNILEEMDASFLGNRMARLSSLRSGRSPNSARRNLHPCLATATR